MEENVKQKIESMYNRLMERPNIIYSIFKDFFGEEFVDMQGYLSLEEYTSGVSRNYSEETILEAEVHNYNSSLFNDIFILVRFPEVRVTNENDKYIDIWELYAKCPIKWNGTSLGYFALNRAEYDLFQLRNNYLHSHVSGIPFVYTTEFQSPCLGSGPIRDTLAMLSTSFDELRWQLFCLELSKYVEVESLSGGPYKKLEELGKNSLTIGEHTWSMIPDHRLPTFRSFRGERVKNFVRWLIRRNKLKFDYNGSYGISMPFINWIIFLSNEFIEWYNIEFAEGNITTRYSQLLSEGVLRRGIINNNRLYYEGESNENNYSTFIGKKICTFKGRDVVVSIRNLNDRVDDNNMSNFINVKLAEHIYKCILEIINYAYGNNSTETQTTGPSKELIFV